LQNDGTGLFQAASEIPVGREPNFLFVADANRDGQLDLLVGNDRSNTVTILPGTGSGFGTPRADSLADRPRPLVAEDFDGDGHVDLVMADEGEDTVRVYPRDKSGRLGSPVNVKTGPHPRDVAAGDFNEDGLADLAVIHRKGRTVSILINTSSSSPRR
jgi:hypothetical protein